MSATDNAEVIAGAHDVLDWFDGDDLGIDLAPGIWTSEVEAAIIPALAVTEAALIYITELLGVDRAKVITDLHRILNHNPDAGILYIEIPDPGRETG